MHYWPEKISPRKGKDKKTHGKIEGGRWLGSKIDGRTSALNPPPGGS